MIKKCLVGYLVFAMFVVGIAPRVDAAFSASEPLKLSAEARTGDLETIRAALEHKVVAQRLLDLGYTSEEVMTRLSEMTDAQMHGFAQRLDELRVGGDGTGVIIFLLVVIIGVLIYLQVTGRKVKVTK
jgi:hypothetical protein